MSSNSITVVGNVTRDPDLRYLTSGTANLTLGVAVNRRYQKNGEWEEETSFFDVVCWRDLADNVAESVNKGDRIIVTGRLEQRSWEGKDGDKQYRVEIVADEVGPSLRWATARTDRILRDRHGASGPSKAAYEPPKTETYDNGEEPF